VPDTGQSSRTLTILRKARADAATERRRADGGRRGDLVSPIRQLPDREPTNRGIRMGLGGGSSQSRGSSSPERCRASGEQLPAGLLLTKLKPALPSPPSPRPHPRRRGTAFARCGRKRYKRIARACRIPREKRDPDRTVSRSGNRSSELSRDSALYPLSARGDTKARILHESRARTITERGNGSIRNRRVCPSLGAVT